MLKEQMETTENHFGSSCRTSTSTSAAAVAAHGDVFTASGRLHTLRNFFAFDDTPNLIEDPEGNGEICPNPPSNQRYHHIIPPYPTCLVFARARIHHPRRGFALATTPRRTHTNVRRVQVASVRCAAGGTRPCYRESQHAGYSRPSRLCDFSHWGRAV